MNLHNVQWAAWSAYWDARWKHRLPFTAIEFGSRSTLYVIDPTTHQRRRIGRKA